MGAETPVSGAPRTRAGVDVTGRSNRRLLFGLNDIAPLGEAIRPPLAHATRLRRGMLGGWNGYYGEPWPIVLVKGHVRLTTMLEDIKRFGLARIRQGVSAP